MRRIFVFIHIVCLLFSFVARAQDQEEAEQKEVSESESTPEKPPGSEETSETGKETLQPSPDSTTAVQEEHLFIGFPMQVKWKFRARGPIMARPEVDDSAVYIASKGGFVYRVMQTQAKQVWRRNLNDTVEESFLLSGETIFIGTTGGSVHALNKEKGKELWKQSLKEETFRKKPAVDSERIFFVGTAGTMTALEKQTGRLQWRFKADGECLGEPFAIENVVLFGCSDQTLYALDAKAGFVRWKYKADSEIQGSPIADDLHVYFGSESGYFFCLHRDTGQLRWKRRTGGAIRGKPMFYFNERKEIVEDILITSYDNFLYRLSIKNGGRRWLSPTTTRAETGMHFDRALIFLAPFGQVLYGYDPHTGDRIGEFNAKGRIRSAPVTAQDRLFIGLNNGNLLCTMRVPPPKPETDETLTPQVSQPAVSSATEAPTEEEPSEQDADSTENEEEPPQDRLLLF